MTNTITYEEGQDCPECEDGVLEWNRRDGESCSCHINPPCSACVDSILTCTHCQCAPNEEE